jgi:hypothetical protein
MLIFRGYFRGILGTNGKSKHLQVWRRAGVSLYLAKTSPGRQAFENHARIIFSVLA